MLAPVAQVVHLDHHTRVGIAALKAHVAQPFAVLLEEAFAEPIERVPGFFQASTLKGFVICQLTRCS